MRTSSLSSTDALKQGKESKLPVVILFGDTGPKSKLFSQVLGDTSLDEVFSRVAFTTIEFKKDDETAKTYKVTAAPTLVIVDNTGAESKEIKKMTSGSPASIKKELEAAVKKLAAGK